jgi:predicted nuclease of predicted toxin-antitoxin system
MIWARLHEHIVFTHDLDYGAILHATGATAPSVIQVRTEDVRPEKAADLILRALKTAAPDLLSGALITVDPRKTRLSVLPLRKRS